MNQETAFKEMIKRFKATNEEWQIVGVENFAKKLQKKTGVETKEAQITIQAILGKFGVWFSLWESIIDVNLKYFPENRKPPIYIYKIYAATESPRFVNDKQNLGTVFFQITWMCDENNPLSITSFNFDISLPYTKDVERLIFLQDTFVAMTRAHV